MGNQRNLIEINGKKYDAVTGALIGSQSKPKISPPVQATKPVVDGFVKRPHHNVPISSTRTANSAPVHKGQHAKTLMRAAVKKPSTLHVASVPSPKKPKSGAIKAIVLPRTAVVPAEREQHAHEVQKSDMIQRFGTGQAPAPITKKIIDMEVRPAPPMVHNLNNVATVKSKTADLLDRALEAAQGHNEPFHNPEKPLHKRIAKKIGISAKTMAISTTVMTGLLLGGFYAYENVPNLAMRVAAARAGFSASMPGYSPSGFSFRGPVQYSAGQVVVSFKSNADDRSYKLTQQTSSWSSDSLLNNYVAVDGKEYQTYQDRGHNTDIFNGSSATWVNGGIWYQIDGKSDLNSDQLVRIAASL